MRQLTPQNSMNEPEIKTKSKLVAELRQAAHIRISRQTETARKKFSRENYAKPKINPDSSSHFTWEKNIGGEVPVELPETNLARATDDSIPRQAPSPVKPKTNIDPRYARDKIKSEMQKLADDFIPADTKESS